MLRVMLDRPPTTLNPRMAADSYGQRIGEMLFGALTLKDADMQPQPYFADSWKSSAGGLLWTFHLKGGLKDQADQDITAERLASCFNEYLRGKPKSVIMTSFESVKSISAGPSSLTFELSRPDPYLPVNLTLFRYFTTGDPSKPCREPKAGDAIIGSGDYEVPGLHFEGLSPDNSVDLKPRDPSRPLLRFNWSFDDNAKALALIRGDVDVLPTSLSLAKTRWIESHYADRFRVVSRSNGVNVSYIQFNFKNPILNHLEVRRAIVAAIDRKAYVENKLFGFGTVAGTLLSPVLPESAPQDFAYDPALSEKLLDAAGFKRGADGIRFKLKFKTTPVRDGFEIARFAQSSLKRIGIDVDLEVVEPAVFFASIKKGAFDLYTSRWVGVSDASIFYRSMRSKNPDNRGGYSSPETDLLLDQAARESDLVKRKALTAKIQAKVAQDLPFFPLWFWDPTVIIRKEISGLEPAQISLSSSLVPLAHLR